MTMKFKPFDKKSISATRVGWQNDAENGGGFLPDLEQSLDWAESHIELVENSMAYGVFQDGLSAAIGICELVITKRSSRSKWLKVLRLRLGPKTESGLFSNDPKAVKVAIDAYITCVVGVFHVKNEHKATTIKVYGRTQEQVRFLATLAAAMQASKLETTFKSSIEGRWLVLSWGK